MPSLETKRAIVAGAEGRLARAARTALEDAGFQIVPLRDGEDVLQEITCLVYCMDGADAGMASSSLRDGLEAHLRTEMSEPASLAQRFATALADGRKGLVLYLASRSLTWHRGEPLNAGLGRGGLAHMTQLLAQTLAPRIRVNLIAPGPAIATLTAEPVDATEIDERIRAAIHFLLDAEAVTGEMLALDLGPADIV